MTDLAALTWPDVRREELVLVPVGSTEQHGPHLPFDTDTVIAEAVAVAAADRLGGLVAPALSFGVSGEHQSFAGTVSLSSKALSEVLVELALSLRTWSGPVVFVSANPRNVAALDSAVDRLHDERQPVAWVECAAEHLDLHAGHTETSLMLYLKPHVVRQDRMVAGDARSLPDILPILAAGGVAAVSSNGVLGDPTHANAGEGALILDAMVDAVVDACILLGRPPRSARPIAG